MSKGGVLYEGYKPIQKFIKNENGTDELNEELYNNIISDLKNNIGCKISGDIWVKKVR
jgi:hypothetical protein